MKRWLALPLLVALLGAGPSANGLGLISVDEAHWLPRPMPPIWPPPRPMPPFQPHVFAPLELASCKVATRITDQLAVTTVDQEFFNPNPTRLEGTFIFPVPKGAHLDKFAMEIDGKPVQAELLAADKARGIYEDIVRRAKDPALLEYADRDLFKVRIFPIELRAPKRITVRYTQLLKLDGGLIACELPLNAAKYSSKPIGSVSVKVDLETQRPLKSIYSPSHAVEITRHGPGRATIGYEGRNVVPDADFTLYFAPEPDEIGVNLLTHRAAGEDGYFLLLAAPGIDVKDAKVLPKDVAFVLDTSGSMSGKKLEQAKKALAFCVENLNAGDRFEVMRFSTEVEPLFNQLAPADPVHREQAQRFLQDLKAIGGTAIDDALQKALGLAQKRELSVEASDPLPLGDRRPFVLIFLTDGLPTVGTTDAGQILGNVQKAGGGRVRIFCFGIGTDVNTHLLDKVAEETRAFTTYVLPEEDLEVKLSNFFAKIKEPVLASPKLEFTGDIRTTKRHPARLPDLFKGEQLVLVGRYTGGGAAAVRIEGVINGKPRTFTTDVRFAGDPGGAEFIPRLWATRRVGYLLDEIRLHGKNDELKDEVTELARKYGLVTPYTAYLILEDEARRGVPVTAQSLPQLRQEQPARAMEMMRRRYGVTASGREAVGNARANQAYKQADNLAAAATGSSEASQAYALSGVANPTPSAGGASAGPSTAPTFQQNAQFVAGRACYLNGNQWTDSLVQQQSAQARRVRLAFNSPEYFDLAVTNALARPWLALGQNVQFVLGGTIYEVHE